MEWRAKRRAAASEDQGDMTRASSLLVSARWVPPSRFWPSRRWGKRALDRAYSLDQVVSEALAHHPRLRALLADEETAEARVEEARLGEIPHAGLSAQINRSTGNTPPGAFYPTTGFPPISGAPRGRSFDDGAWQTGVSVWASWDVLSLARQAAALDVALAARSEEAAATNAQRLEIAYRGGRRLPCSCSRRRRRSVPRRRASIAPGSSWR